MAPRRDRAVEIAQRAGADALLAADPATVTWLTGYAADTETGPSPFAHSPLALLAPGSSPVLIVSEDEASAAAAGGCEVVTYPGFGLGPIDPSAEPHERWRRSSPTGRSRRSAARW